MTESIKESWKVGRASYSPNTGPLTARSQGVLAFLSARVKRQLLPESPLRLAGPEKAFDGIQDLQLQVGLLKILSWRSLRRWWRHALWPCPCPENGTENPPGKGVLPVPKKAERPYRQREDSGNVRVLLRSPSWLHLPHSLGPITFLHDRLLFIRPTTETLRVHSFSRSSFP